MFERELRDLAHIPRWGIQRRIRQQNVAEHSYYVAVYAAQIAEFWEYSPVSKGQIMQYALLHDLGELWSGDIPAPFKKKNLNRTLNSQFEKYQTRRVFGEQGVLSDTGMEHHWVDLVRVADLIEACLYLADELQMGNQSVGYRNAPDTTFGDVYRALLRAVHAADDKYGWAKMDGGDRLMEFMQHVEEALSTAQSGMSRIFVHRP